MDTLVTGGTLLTMGGERLGIVDDGAVGIDGGDIVSVGPAADAPDPGDAAVVDADGCVVMPGLVNAHAHTGLTLLRGGAQDVPEIEWMNRALGPLANTIDESDRVLGTRLGVLETVRSGATTVCEYASDVAGLVEEVYRPLGVRVVATETITEVPEDRSDLGPRDLYPFDRERGDRALARADDLFATFGDDPLVEPMYGPQALDMVSPDLLATVRDHAKERNARIHMHVAQGEREALQIEERYGAAATTVSVLDDHDYLDDRLVAAHLHGTTPEERERLVEAGVGMAGCPSSIGAIDGIVPPIADYRQRGGVVGIGTDQAPGPGHHNALREARTASTFSKVAASDPTAVPAWEALRMATVGGARLLGIDDRVGRLAEGMRADLVVVDTGTLGLAPTVTDPLHTAVPNLVYGATGREVRDVFVAGDALLRDGAFVGVDVDSVLEAADARATAAFARGADDWRDAGSELVDRVDDGWL